MKPTRRDIIDYLQDSVLHNRITMDELEKECKQHDIDLFDDVIHPIDYNLCDRCGDYGDSEQDFLWVDSFDWQKDNPEDQAIIKALEQEGVDYCAICWKCVNELKKKGKK